MSERDYPTYDEIEEAQRQLAHNYSCNRAHCSPEERAVIDAALVEELTRRAYYNSIETRDWSASGELLKKLGARIVAREVAVDGLLATRSKSEVRG